MRSYILTFLFFFSCNVLAGEALEAIIDHVNSQQESYMPDVYYQMQIDDLRNDQIRRELDEEWVDQQIEHRHDRIMQDRFGDYDE